MIDASLQAMDQRMLLIQLVNSLSTSVIASWTSIDDSLVDIDLLCNAFQKRISIWKINSDRLPYSLVCSPLAFPWFVVVRVSKVQERVHKAAEGISKGTQLTQDKISNDKVEGQIQVDRKRLESMITGEPLYGSEKFLPSAEEFFQKVTELSGAVISWPSRLKIGAKTKKDPYVKMFGTVEQVNCARQLIASTLRIKRDKISLRIEIPHCDHSKIIGRKGKNTQDIMRDTMCHIHFPDSNRIHDMEKNNQVSVSGTVRQVEKARQRLRKLSPLCIVCELPNTCRYSFQELQRNIGHSDIFQS
ncbi:unnamed protein product [Wuchereria bancrofti]|uniref:K Homology domain-containing protein n=1 Tax=Wuchereria bancrofti TaxID=6293 RepID=A0A3P7E1D9_WUCBA|nr:unnamed protein product [Wuchereria bancrofti]